MKNILYDSTKGRIIAIFADESVCSYFAQIYSGYYSQRSSESLAKSARGRNALGHFYAQIKK